MVFYRPLNQMYLSTHPPCGFGWIDGHMTSRNQGLSFNNQGRQRRETLGTRLPSSEPQHNSQAAATAVMAIRAINNIIKALISGYS